MAELCTLHKGHKSDGVCLSGHIVQCMSGTVHVIHDLRLVQGHIMWSSEPSASISKQQLPASCMLSPLPIETLSGFPTM